MGYQTRDERLEAQDDDDGVEDDDVYVHVGTKTTMYHDSEDCRTLLESYESMTRKAA